MPSIALTEQERPQPQGHAFDIQVVTEYRAFVDLEATWNQLVDQAAIEFPFVRHEWVRAFWDCFDHGGSLYILLVMAQGRPIGIAPLMRDRTRMYGILVRRIRALTNVYSERFDFILPIDAKECSAAIWAHLAAHAREWDVLELRQLPADCRVLDTLPRAQISRQQLLLGEWTSTESPYIRVRQPWEAYFKSLKKGHRANIRKSLQHLEATAPVGLDVVASDDERLEADIEEALTLEAVAWKDEGGTAIRSRPDTTAFYQRILRMAAERGWLRIYFLTLGGKRIAVRMALLFRNKIYMLKSGYDPQYAVYSPGHLLCHKILDEAWQLRFEELDFLGNVERWKLNWARDLRRHSWLFAFPKRPKPWLLHRLKFAIIPRIRNSRLYAPLRRAATNLDVTIQGE